MQQVHDNQRQHESNMNKWMNESLNSLEIISDRLQIVSLSLHQTDIQKLGMRRVKGTYLSPFVSQTPLPQLIKEAMNQHNTKNQLPTFMTKIE